MRALITLSMVLLALGAPATGAAQSSGGSYGSSDFGSSSGGSSSSGSSYGGGGSSSSGGSGRSRSSEPTSAATVSLPDGEYGERYVNRSAGAVAISDAERAARDDTGGLWMIGSGCCSFGLFALLFGYATFAFGRSKHAAPTGPYEVRQVSVAFDWTTRRALQERLTAMAQRFGDGEAGRREGSREAAQLLAGACGSARYAAFQTFRCKERDAEGRFHAMATDLRARYRHETAGARASGTTPAMRARAEEGEGLVVVSVVVAWRGHMAPLPGDLDPRAAAQALATLTPRPDVEVVALEVIWSPAEEQDRMSSAELEMVYPELQRLDARLDVGRMGCTYCRAVFPGELGRCPACGAPADT